MPKIINASGELVDSNENDENNSDENTGKQKKDKNERLAEKFELVESSERNKNLAVFNDVYKNMQAKIFASRNPELIEALHKCSPRIISRALTILSSEIVIMSYVYQWEKSRKLVDIIKKVLQGEMKNDANNNEDNLEPNEE